MTFDKTVFNCLASLHQSIQEMKHYQSKIKLAIEVSGILGLATLV